jgi:hypothetical protein
MIDTPKKEKRKTAYRRLLQILAILLVLGSCNFGTPDYKLNVTLEEGVTGNPGPGEHAYKDLEEVSYEYTAINPIHTVEVFLNNIRQTYTGTFTMYTNVDLIARLVDIRGRWHVTMQQVDPNQTFEFDITLDGGGLTNGTFSDSRGYSGTWTAENGAVTITFSDWETYELRGTVYDMSGTFQNEGEDKGGWDSERLS